MSLKRTIMGKIFITDFQVAKDAVINHPAVKIVGNQFTMVVMDEYRSTTSEIYQVEEIYRMNLLEKQRKQEEERKRLEEERKRLVEEKRIIENQKEFLAQLIEVEKKILQNKKENENNENQINLRKREEEKVQEEKEKYRSEREARIIANAEKKGFTIKKRITEDNKVKLILQRRDF